MFDPDNTPTTWQQIPSTTIARTDSILKKATSIAISHKHHIQENSSPESYERTTVVQQLNKDINEMEDCRYLITNPEFPINTIESSTAIQTL